MAKKTVINALKAACAEIGAEMKKTSCDLFIVERDNIDYFFDVDEKNGRFCILQTVMGLNGKLTESDFNTMLDVVKNFHKDYDGEWNDGVSFISSKWYSKEVDGESLKKIIDDFFTSWSFACANACLLTDTSIWK